MIIRLKSMSSVAIPHLKAYNSLSTYRERGSEVYRSIPEYTGVYRSLPKLTVRNRKFTVRNRKFTVRNRKFTVRNRKFTVRNW